MLIDQITQDLLWRVFVLEPIGERYLARWLHEEQSYG